MYNTYNINPKKRTRIDQNLLKINKHQKLPNTPITILRNIAASKVAVGPLTTSNSKIATNLNPQVELIAANTKIK